MTVRRQPARALLGALALSALTGALALAQPGGGDEQPVTLTLHTADTRDRQAAAAADEFVTLVAELSNGSVTVEPAFGVLAPGLAVIDGTADLGMLPTRDWHALGATTMNALETPFLVDSDALADAIARSDTATQAMSSLEALGVTGLAMWPEDLRHLFAFEPSGAVFLAPDDVAGSTILMVAGPPGHDLVKTLGGMVWQEGVRDGAFTGERHSDAVSGALTGMATGLSGAGLPIGDQTVVAGDIPLFAKFQMLVANTEALARLSTAQRDALIEAATATRESAIERRATEVELGRRYCESGGGRIIHAGPEALAAFRSAAEPVVAELRSDPANGALITAIEALKATIPATPPAAPCDGDTAIETGAEPTGTADHLGTVPPPGIYRADITEEDLLARGSSADFAIRNSAIVTLEFSEDGTYVFEFGSRCPGTVHSPDGSYFVLEEEPGHPCGVGGAFRWRAEPEGIALVFPFTEGLTARDVADIRAFFERPWARIGDVEVDVELSELPELGTWRIEQSVASLTAQGVDEGTAAQWAGVVTLEFDGARWSMEHVWGPDRRTSTCGGTYGLEDGVLELAFDVNPAECGTAPVYLVWSSDGPDRANVALGSGGEPVGIFAGEWIRVDTQATALIPDGIYRMELTLDEALAAGATMEWAIHDLAGTNTLEFRGHEGIWRFRPSEAESRGPRDDGFTIRVEGGHVILDGSKTGYRTIDTVTWRLDGEQLTIELLSTTPQSDFEFDRILLETKPWIRIGDVED